ncbi:hypothetical protein TGAM01_v205178 [Trichoderma gamsii]|uniref:Uncharacterized protein n=1 Tax=Trichoderma gamsii TaxID=398673 RepID=A0A2P4ZN71_9HYPO|nr:hypothetical protein TGAM01_v205178 [Trichoderma gamsii]PON25741.1 hypothetical protein TGAM01_v205178 [Trichoderma gamsii]
MLEFYMAWTALRLMNKEQKSVKWPWWFQMLSFSWLPSHRHYLNSKTKDLESQDVRSLESQDARNSESQHPRGSECQNARDLKSQRAKSSEKQNDSCGESQDARIAESQDGTDQSEKRTWTLTHCYFANMGGFIHAAKGKRFLVTAQQLAKMEGLSYASPEVTEEDIKDKSKQDWLAKLIAALQILQLIFSIITRHIQRLQFSQLETVTLSFAICGVLIYCAYFYKPQNIERAFEIKDITNNTADWFSSLQFEKTYDSLWAIMRNKETSSKEANSKYLNSNEADNAKYQKATRIPNDNIPIYRGNNDVHPVVYLLALSSGLFGAIHAIAWHFEFPTKVERLLWQIATCISAASPVVGLVAVPISQFTKADGDPELFAGNCLRVIQEYSWHNPNTPWVRNAIKDLEDAIAKAEPKRYSDIFREAGDSMLVDLRDYLDLKGRFQGLDPKIFELHSDELFIRNFHRLLNAVFGKETKKVEEAARVGVWPRQSLLPRGVNQGILYLTGFLYCAARLLLLAISISSIRKMPGSVYIVTDWTGYLPTFGAMGG